LKFDPLFLRQQGLSQNCIGQRQQTVAENGLIGSAPISEPTILGAELQYFGSILADAKPESQILK
jgi:hypothetical protein